MLLIPYFISIENLEIRLIIKGEGELNILNN